MIKVAVTGGITSGKTTFCKLIEKKGIPVFYADEVVAKLYKRKEIIQKIKTLLQNLKNNESNFNDDWKWMDKTIDKKKIREIFLKDERFRKGLERIFHPVVKEELEKFLKAQERKKVPICVAEIPLLFEVGWENLFDEIWVIYCNKETQIKRAIQRGLTKQEALCFLNLQIPLEEKKKRAHKVFSSEKPLEILEKEIDQALKELKVLDHSLRAK